ncbi:MAG: DUF4124 domain-containing protein [Gammaproteobacteria bacterium]|nr:DUF4124 domain-containing protein [Gammaproteobacteria bacterium]MDH4253574.1 DUF4124 domain-containing protein [Gammaproteobacteria bacterium]MDH5310159.1 DUF4124 domain-containing protein [Gammaproteobacteria bacterium]
MTRLSAAILGLMLCAAADADIWKWVDAQGNTHFVDSDRPIYTWVDETGKIHYSDKPDHENAVSVQLVWHSTGDLAEIGADKPAAKRDDDQYRNETAADRAEREMAEAYYCKRAQEVYDSYVKAPRLYRTVDGERIYLSDEEAAQTLSETKARVDELCN